MGRVEKTIFISYRRTNIPWALAIYQNLTTHGFDVFFDYESIASGDFEQIILGNIRARAHFLVILTPSALERCNEPGDWLRREIETALDEKRNIVPIFLEGFDFGSPSISKYLTGKLVKLKNYNGLNIPAGYFNEAMERIRSKFLNIALDAVLHPVSITVKKAVEQQQNAASDAINIQEKELNSQEWYERGIETPNLDEKVICYTEAIRLKPDFCWAYNNRGVAFYEKGEFDNAINDYSEAIQLQPDYANIYNNRGVARKKNGDIKGAITDYNEAIRVNPDLADAYINRSYAHEGIGDLDSAIKDYTEILRLDPQNPIHFRNRASVRQDNGDTDNAIADYTEAIRLKPDFAEAYNGRGIARKEKSDLNGALIDFTEAIWISPHDDAYYNNRGAIRSMQKDIDGAIKDFNEAIRLNPNNVMAYYNRASNCAYIRNYSAAVSDYQKFLDLDGGKQHQNQEEIEKRIKDLKRRAFIDKSEFKI